MIFEDLPLGPQWVLSSTDLQAIATDFGLVLDPRDADHHSDLSGAVNGVARTRTIAGQDILVRVHRPWTTIPRLEAVHGVMAALRAQGLPVPNVLITPAGRTWTCIADRLVEVQQFIPSIRAAHSTTDGILAFTALAQLHHALGAFPIGELPKAPYDSWASPKHALAMLDDTERAFATHGPEPMFPLASAIRARSRHLLTRLQQALTTLEDRLPQQLTHGDYGGGNVLIGEHAVCGILDFDFMDYRERIYDIAYGAVNTILRARKQGGPTELSWEERGFIRSSLAAYNATARSPLIEAECVALPLVMAQVPLYQIAEAGYQETARHAISQTIAQESGLAFSEWIEDNRDTVIRWIHDPGSG